MANTKTNSKNKSATGASARDIEVDAEVLFQRIYDKWYAFSLVEDECLVTEVPEEEVNKRLATRKLAGAA